MSDAEPDHLHSRSAQDLSRRRSGRARAARRQSGYRTRRVRVHRRDPRDRESRRCFTSLADLTPPTAGSIQLDGRDLLGLTDAAAHRTAQDDGGFRVSEIQSAAHADRARQYRDRAAHRAQERPAGSEVRRNFEAARTHRAAGSQAARAFGRRAAAGGHRARDRESSRPFCWPTNPPEIWTPRIPTPFWDCCAT